MFPFLQKFYNRSTELYIIAGQGTFYDLSLFYQKTIQRDRFRGFSPTTLQRQKNVELK